MVKIRLTRIGEKKVPFYRIVVADALTPRSGRAIDTIGTYDPNTDPSTVMSKLRRNGLQTAHSPLPLSKNFSSRPGLNKKAFPDLMIGRKSE